MRWNAFEARFTSNAMKWCHLKMHSTLFTVFAFVIPFLRFIIIYISIEWRRERTKKSHSEPSIPVSMCAHKLCEWQVLRCDKCVFIKWLEQARAPDETARQINTWMCQTAFASFILNRNQHFCLSIHANTCRLNFNIWFSSHLSRTALCPPTEINV